MKHLRRFALVSTIVGALVGVFVRLELASPPREYLLDFSKFSSEERAKIGPFIFENLTDRYSPTPTLQLRFRSAYCEEAIFVTVSKVSVALPENLIAQLYPAAQWRTLYVYHQKARETFARIPAHVRLLVFHSIAALTLSSHNLSQEYVFRYHIPVGCTIPTGAAIDASNDILAMAASPNY